MPPLVSIIIPCYNAEEWIGEAIQSALDQTWRAREIIVVDDGSRDNSHAIAKRRESGRLKVISQENCGNGAARNRGLNEAQGELIQFLDADDVLAPDKIQIQVQKLLESPSGYIASATWGRFHDSPCSTKFIPESVWSETNPIDWLIKSWSGEGMMAVHAWLTPRNLIEAAGPWNESLKRNVDGEYFARVLLKCDRIVFCPEAAAFYRSNVKHSVSRTQTAEVLRSVYDAIELCGEHLLAAEPSARARKAVATLFQDFAHQAFPFFPELVLMAERRVNELGGCSLRLKQGLFFNLAAGCFGWKAAKRLQVEYHAIKGMFEKSSQNRRTAR